MQAQVAAKKRAAEIAAQEARNSANSKGGSGGSESRTKDQKSSNQKWVCEGDSCKMVDT